MTLPKWNIGSFYKKIRLSKGVTQQKICGSTLSRTTLSKFENNKLVPSYETMCYLLSQIGMTYEEFGYVCNDYKHDERDELINSFFHQVSNMDKQFLFSFQKRCEIYLQQNDDIFVADVLRITDSLLNLAEDSIKKIDCLPKIIVSKVWDRLSKMDMWYYDEIRLINCLLFYFSQDSLLSISERLLISLERYEEFRPMKVLRISIVLNLSCLLIQNNKTKNSVELIEKALIWSKEEHRYDYLGIAKVRLGIC
ncbi:MAG TPA: Rgg/GadR/MutR family transcriptional regulator [Candidatus Tetragenococcus pullicola]|nr:Rgg/GadR/MutR family transcriptional regulator [Candidatus Tetragenococcus pullicola]